jgi:nucleoside-diphosphate-sugar epimerase
VAPTGKVFVLGATGYLGTAITARLVRGGLDVRGLARDAERARVVEALGARTVLGRLEEPEGVVAEMKNCDAVVQAAIDDADPEATDRAALEIVRTAAHDGRVRRVLYTSSVWAHGDTRGAIADETTPLAPPERSRWRPSHERAALDLEEAEVATVVFRPSVVYGGRGGILGDWFEEAKAKGTVTYPGDGAQRWGIVHRDDLADAYALALEHARGGECYLLVDESRLTVRELAEAVAAATRARAIPRDRRELVEALGPYGQALLMDQQFTSARARRELGWVPRHVSFVAEARALLREWESAAPAVAG